jgi:hypothetical protein
LIEIGLLVLERKILKKIIEFELLFRYHLPLEKGVALQLHF